jgi:hypothetical protein
VTPGNDVIVTPGNDVIVTPGNDVIVTPGNDVIVTPGNDVIVTPELPPINPNTQPLYYQEFLNLGNQPSNTPIFLPNQQIPPQSSTPSSPSEYLSDAEIVGFADPSLLSALPDPVSRIPENQRQFFLDQAQQRRLEVDERYRIPPDMMMMAGEDGFGQTLPEALERGPIPPTSPNLRPHFRGTTEGYSGNPGIADTGPTPVTVNPAAATVFSAQASAYGEPVIHIALPGDLFGVTIDPGGNTSAGNTLRGAERERSANISPTEFATRSSITVRAEDARAILRGMGVDVPRYVPTGDVTSVLQSVPNLSRSQVRDFVERARQYNIRIPIEPPHRD